MIPDEIKQKIDKLRKVYLLPEDQKIFDATEINLRKKILASKLKQNDLVQEIIADANERIGHLNFLLANDETLSETERNKLFQERRVHRFWLNRFGYDAETYVKSTEAALNKLLSTDDVR